MSHTFSWWCNACDTASEELPTPEASVAGLAAHRLVCPARAAVAIAGMPNMEAVALEHADLERFKLARLLSALVHELGGEVDVNLDAASDIRGQLEFELSPDSSTVTVRLVEGV